MVLILLLVMVMTLFMTHALVTTAFFMTHDRIGVLLLVSQRHDDGVFSYP
jgi:hypothetical protein